MVIVIGQSLQVFKKRAVCVRVHQSPSIQTHLQSWSIIRSGSPSLLARLFNLFSIALVRNSDNPACKHRTELANSAKRKLTMAGNSPWQETNNGDGALLSVDTGTGTNNCPDDTRTDQFSRSNVPLSPSAHSLPPLCLSGTVLTKAIGSKTRGTDLVLSQMTTKTDTVTCYLGLTGYPRVPRGGR
jgi:hypothetical protein